MDYLTLACQKLDVAPDRILSHRVYDDRIVLVVDNGVAGCPMHTLALADLVPPQPVTPPPDIKDELLKMKVSELRALARAADIDNYGRLKKAELIEALNQ